MRTLFLKLTRIFLSFKAKEIKKVVFVIFIFFIAISLFRYFFIDIYLVTSGSMFPSINSNEKVVVNKYIYGSRCINLRLLILQGKVSYNRIFQFRLIEHNDIILFNYPIYFDNAVCYGGKCIKRCVGIPNDTIYIHKKLNNLRLSRISEQKRADDSLQSFYDYCNDGNPIYIPSLGEKIKLTNRNIFLYSKLIRSEDSLVYFKNNKLYKNNDLYEIHIFKKSYLFVIGDCFNSSTDSRSFGFVPLSHVIGRIDYSIHFSDALKRKVLRRLPTIPKNTYDVFIE